MSVDSPRGKVCLFDDFLGDTLATDLYVGTASTGGTVAITSTVVDGVVDLTTDATDGDAAQLAGNAQWRVQDGSLRLEARVQTDVVTTLAQFIGFTDATSETDTIPMTLSGTTFTTTATTAVGFLFDTEATNDNWHAMWVDDDVDSSEAIADLRFSGVAPVAATYYTYIVELQDRGSGLGARAVFSIIDNNGKMYQKTFTTNIDRDAALVPYIGHENHGAAAHVTRVDYWDVSKSRA